MRRTTDQKLRRVMSFTSYVALKEDEYNKLRQRRHEEAALKSQELARPSEILPLSRAENAQNRIVFSKLESEAEA